MKEFKNLPQKREVFFRFGIWNIRAIMDDSHNMDP